jgi:hypothetical protein
MRNSIFLCLLLLSTLFSKGQVAIPGSSTITLDGKSDKDTLLVALAPEAGSDWASFLPEGTWPNMVRLNGASRRRFTDAVQVQKNPGNPALVITVDMTRLDIPGSYDVSIAYKTDKTAHGMLTFTLVRPAATLETGKTLHISFAGDDADLESLSLRETSGASNIYGLHLSSPVVAAIPSGHLIQFSNSPYNVTASNYFQANYTVDKALAASLPIGTTTGKMIITAPQLATPVEVSFEILKRRSLWVIFFVTLAGLVFGFLVRTVLQQRKESERARFGGFSLAQFISDDSEDIKDPDFKSDVDATLAGLATLLRRKGRFEFITGPDKQLNDEIAAFKKQYEDRKAKLEADIKLIKDQFLLLADALNNTTLSPDIQPLLSAPRATIEKLKGNLDDRNLAESKAAVAETLEAIKTMTQDFKNALENKVTFLSKQEAYPQSFVSADSFTKLNAVLAGIKTESDTLSPATAKPEELSARIGAVSALQGKMTGFFDTVTGTVAADIKSKGSTIFSSGSLSDAYKSWVQELGTYIHNAGPVSDEQEAKIIQLAASLDKKITTVANNLRQGGGEESQAPSFVASNHTVVTAVNKNFRVTEGKTFINEGLAASGRAFLISSLLQMLFLAVILGLAAIKFYAPHFTGTTDDLITIFFFSFTMDLTVDNVVAKVKQG